MGIYLSLFYYKGTQQCSYSFLLKDYQLTFKKKTKKQRLPNQFLLTNGERREMRFFSLLYSKLYYPDSKNVYSVPSLSQRTYCHASLHGDLGHISVAKSNLNIVTMTSNLQMNMPELRVKTPNALEYNFIK
jgi:hypothetical protein